MSKETDFQIKDGCLEKYLGQDAAVVIPDGVTSIGTRAFDDCANLTSVVVPAGVTSIGWGAFKRCPSLTSVTLPDGLTDIGDYAFTGDAALESIHLPESVKTIGRFAFSNCAALHGLDLPACIESIGDYAFLNCVPKGPVTFFLPASLKRLGCGAFDFSKAWDIIVENGNPVYDNRDSCNAVIETATNTLLYGCRSTVIPNTVTSIGSAFAGCTDLTEIAIPDSVISIGRLAFSGCRELTDITIPDSVTEIDEGAFNGCVGLTSVTIGRGVKRIALAAFQFCDSLADVYFNGTEAEWNAIDIDAGNDPLLDASIRFTA